MPHTARRACAISPSAARSASASRIGGSTLAAPAAALRSSLSARVTAPVVALGAQHGEALALVGLDLRVSPQRLIRLVPASGELVDPDDGARSAVDLLGDLMGGGFDLGFLEACSTAATALTGSWYRSLDSFAVPNPAYCRIVHGRPAYIDRSTPPRERKPAGNVQPRGRVEAV